MKHSATWLCAAAAISLAVCSAAQAQQYPNQDIHFVTGFPLLAAVTRASAAELDLAPGARVQAAIKATAVHLIARG